MKPTHRKCLFLAFFLLSFPFAALATNAPSNLTATGSSSSQINLTWTDNSSDEIGFTFAFDTNSGLTNATYTWAGGANTTGYSHTGRSPATTYFYKIKAEGNPDSSWTTIKSATTTPASLAASVVSSSQINLSWTGNSGNSNIVGYTIAYATNSSFSGAVYQYVAGAGTASFNHTGLSAVTTYYYKIKAEGTADSYDSAFTASISATTSGAAPNAPSGLSATVMSSSQINLSWTDNSTNETGFEVKRATDSGFTQNVVWIGGIQGATFANSGLSPSTTYYYKVRAEGTAGKSAYSNSASETTDPAASSQPFAGINAWMPYQIGAQKYYGKLDTSWGDVQASGAQIVRYGGNGVDHYANPQWSDPTDPTKSTLNQYVALVDAMRSHGMEPVLQVPVYGTYTSSQAADIVRHVNVTNVRAVRYWVIGNEPDLDGTGYGSGYTNAAQVAAYFKPFASAMKAVDPTIKIIGPETAWYDHNIIDGLTSCNGGADDITGTDGNGNYYVDVVSFHAYPFSGSQIRSQVIAKLMETDGFKDDLADLKARLATCDSFHGRTGDDVLQMAVTEANINYQNPSVDGVSGLGAKSFVGGQFWAEMMGIAREQGAAFITFWSVIEGNELGYISGDGATKRPTYYHFQMMAQNFLGSSVAATVNPVDAKVKAFGAEDTDQIAVMIMNQDQASSFNYTVRLDDFTVSGSNPLKINVDAGVAAEYSGNLSTESSLVLIFDTSGAIKKKIEYKLNGHANLNLPPAVTNY